jgi:hypothetical protein
MVIIELSFKIYNKADNMDDSHKVTTNMLEISRE